MVRSGGDVHCIVCLATWVVPLLRGRKQLQENPGEPKCGLHIQATGAGSGTSKRAVATQLS